MSSTFTWLDYSEQHRRRMLDVIDLFAETDTRDELGLGSIRDAFAEQFFPGVSVVQTRARYLLFVPWIYLGLELRGTSSAQVSVRARREEVALINVLAESEDSDGTIGIQARENLQRLPSNVYWQALGRFGIRVFPGHQEPYHRSFDDFHVRAARHRTRSREQEEPDDDLPRNWHAGLPEVPEDFPAGTSFKLPRYEARYLQERILAAASGSLLAFLVDQGQLCERTDFPWQHPQHGDFPAVLRERLQHAKHFSLAAYGAAILYNLMLAERADYPDRVAAYQSALDRWGEEIGRQGPELGRWDRGRFWAAVAAGSSTVADSARQFVKRWLDLILGPGIAERVRDNAAARQMIHARECQLKGPLARLDSPRALELWNGASGVGRMNYRWYTAQTILNDILRGLEPEDDDA